MPNLITLDALAVVSALALCLAFLFARRTPASLPPGPKGWPILGNIFDWPKEKEWLAFTRWGDLYGPIAHANLLGKHFMVINSVDVALDLFERKGAIYSTRPYRTVFNLITADLSTVAAPYGPRLRKLRALLMQTLGSNAAISGFAPLLELNSARFARRVLESSHDGRADELEDKINLSIASTVLNIAYGYEVLEQGDNMYRLASSVSRSIGVLAKAGVFLVDVFPSLRYLPAWFPGGGFHRVLTPIRENFVTLRESTLKYTRDQVDAGVAQPSFVHEHLVDPNLAVEDRPLISYAATSIFLAGSDTSSAALHTFFLAMVLHPSVQQRAQAELDAIVGQDRLPELSDRNRLPYISALVKEVLRWQPIVPQGVPHVNSVDDVHDGYFIPQGSIIVPNIWGFLHDPKTYRNPDDFDPSRFVADGDRVPERDPSELVFGFGRRICPGRFFAEAALFMMFATSLSVFTIAKAKDASGKEMVPTPAYSSEIVSHQSAFPLSITPRSPEAESLIKAIKFHDELK